MKFKFKFENVLHYRKTLEDIAQRNFQEAMAEYNHQKQILSDYYEEIALARENAFNKQIQGGQAGSVLSQIDEFLKGQDVRIERQKTKIQEIEKNVESLREILRQKVIDYKIIEELKEKKRQEFVTENRKREQKATDDLNMMRFKSKGFQNE